METRSAKRQKLRDLNNSWFQNNNTGQDRISDLPDAVIHHILILLPLKSVVQTSILSKRWLDLWYTYPDLDFTTIIYNNNNVTPLSSKSKPDDHLIKNLGNVITKILSLRDKLSDVRLLRFKASMSFSGLHALIRNAVRLRVQELDIKVNTNDIFNFPRSIITHDCLRVLKVKADPGFRLPPSRSMRFGFPTLQILSLCAVYLEKQPTLLDMFTDCVFPQLKKLYLDYFYDLEHLRVSCSLLEELVIQHCRLLQGLEIFSPRLKTLKVSKCFSSDFNTNNRVQIDTPNLHTLDWANNSIPSKISCMQHLKSLHEFTFGNSVTTRKGLYAKELKSLSSFLSRLSHAESLTLLAEFVQIMLENNQLAKIMFHPFVKLRSLKLHTYSVAGLPNILKLCPMIHTLIIVKVTSPFEPTERRWNRHSWDLPINSNEEQRGESHAESLKLLFQHLKVVEIQGISEIHDISLVKFLLEHGNALQDLILYLGDNNNSSRGYHRRGKFKSWIMEFPRASCHVNLAIH